MSLRKKIEHNIRHFRSYILPSHRRSAVNARLAAIPIPKDKPLCLIDFKSIKIDNVTGRYLYHLVTEFEALGYAIAYTDRFRFLATMEIKACKKLLLTHDFSIIPVGSVPASTAIILTDQLNEYPQTTVSVIRVEYEQIRPPVGHDDCFSLPFFVHPEIHESGQVEQFLSKDDQTTTRPLSLLFAGNAKAPKYDAPVLADKYNVLSRVRALAIAESSFGAELVRRPLTLDQLIPSQEHRKSLTIATTQDLRIPSEQWIETLALADFYFACPGVEMPLCHNLIESLAAGSIPILQYHQYLHPNLTHGVNCLVYSDEISLVEMLQLALNMPRDQVEAMSKSTQKYYKTHLQPGQFAKQLIDVNSKKINLFLNAYRVPLTA
ncbi:hypothetical protein [Rubritalea profundi]|uniref:Glycosyl transferase family 1 domain-containing protein n=1 Tax=Rubritalea profundi TaxID=1658618 RepID=A0A2S7TY31_9BACT|nr:hypothetical protein [Rubritalea profundi]PQJ27659.1 hypothetical protein BSZ32_03530 [Rubritalea profundi]